jgi:hypothetical protein
MSKQSKWAILDVEAIHARTLTVLSKLIAACSVPDLPLVVLTFGEPEVAVRQIVGGGKGDGNQRSHTRWTVSLQMDWLEKVHAAGLAVVEGNLVLSAAPSQKGPDCWLCNMLIPVELNGIKAAKLHPVYVVRALDHICWGKNYQSALERCQECFANRLVEGTAEAMVPGVKEK